MKSGSTFSYQIQRDCLYDFGMNMVNIKKDYMPSIRWGNGGGVESSHNLVDLGKFDVEDILRAIPEDKIFIVKTHSSPNKKIADLIGKGYVAACVTWRDPRECIVSLQDIALKEKDAEAHRQRFVDSARFQNALSATIGFVQSAEDWLETPNIMPIPYEKLRIAPHTVAEEFCKFLGISARHEAIVDFYISNKGRIGEYNKGIPRRWVERYALEQIDELHRHFIGFISKYCDSSPINYDFEIRKGCTGAAYPQIGFPPEYWVEELCVFSKSYFERLASGNPQSFEEIACALTDQNDGLPGFYNHLVNALGMSEAEAKSIVENINENICAPYRQ